MVPCFCTIFLDGFYSNIALGGIAENHEFTEQERQIAEEACRFLNLDFGGVDLLFSEDDFPYVCEVNSNAIFTATEEISGVNIARHIAEGIKKTVFPSCSPSPLKSWQSAGNSAVFNGYQGRRSYGNALMLTV